jgi:benzoyl-CoA reductase subunit C
MSRPMDLIRALSAGFMNEQVERFREEGGHVVGYCCTLTPVEILEAGGLMPYRVKALGHPQTDRADARLSRFNCRFCRACLQLGLDGTYDFLDGLVETNGCDQLRGMFENWQYAAPRPFFHYLKAPHVVTAEALDYFALEVGRFRQAVEAHFEVEITDEALWEVVSRQARIQDKLAWLNAQREQPRPALEGSDALRVTLAGGSVLSQIFEGLLDQLIDASANGGRASRRVRLLIGGAATDEPALLEAIEALGVQLVADTFCHGARAWLPPPGEGEPREGDPIRALAERYLRGSRCPRMVDDFERRFKQIHDEAARADARGVILLNNKFCDLHGFDNAMLQRRLEEAGVPVLSLEKDYGSQADLGRMRTRVQAFLERIGGRP